MTLLAPLFASSVVPTLSGRSREGSANVQANPSTPRLRRYARDERGSSLEILRIALRVFLRC
jgi:hypothetical protein